MKIAKTLFPQLFFFIFFIFTFFSGCSNHKHAEISILNHQTIDIGENIIGYGGFLAISHNVMVGLEMASSMPPFFCLKFDELSNSFYYFGSKGRGPNEFLMPYSVQFVNNQTIGVFDVSLNTYFEFSIPNENEELNISKMLKFQTPVFRMIKTAYNQYVGLSLYDGMFLLTDSTGTTINTFFEYPYKDSNERAFVNRSNAYQGVIAANPSKTKFVYSAFNGEIIHFYEIENNNIKVITKIENEFPLYRDRNDQYAGVVYNPDGIVGYVSSYATEEYVYALFCGKKVGGLDYEATRLRIFDWTGTLVEEYELDVAGSSICVSDDDSKLWAIASNPDNSLVFFDLKDSKSAAPPIVELKKDQTKHIEQPEQVIPVFTELSPPSTEPMPIASPLEPMASPTATIIPPFEPVISSAENIVNNFITYRFEVQSKTEQDSVAQKVFETIRTQLDKGNTIELNSFNITNTQTDTISPNLMKIRINIGE